MEGKTAEVPNLNFDAFFHQQVKAEKQASWSSVQPQSSSLIQPLTVWSQFPHRVHPAHILPVQ